ncbi:MAG: SDR family oxidoreductase [Planctomycetes bacterium]|nr:SDR family oxidoreductase [Planctomycetota bacterium]
MAVAGVSVAGKTALVTGAAKRIGKAIATTLAQSGVHIVVHYNQSAPDAVALCEEIQQLGVRAWPIQGDLMDTEQTGRVFQEAVAQAGPIDLLVNNASIFERDTLWEATEESLAKNVRIHAVAPLILSRELAKQQRAAHVVNLLDTRIAVYDREHASYDLSKSMLLTLTRMLALELAPNVAVNAVAPGSILPPPGRSETYLMKLAHANPQNRIGTPEDIADAVLFLLRSRFITGQVIYVDGGIHMKGRIYD